MNKVITSGKACIAGSPMHIIGNKVMENIYLALDLELRDVE